MQPCQEMIDELQKSTLEYIASRPEPRHAYVMYELPKESYSRLPGSKEYTLTCKYGVGVINCEDHNEIARIRHELENNGNKLIAWGNFPSAHDSNIARQKKYHLYKDESGRTHWDEINDYLMQRIRVYSTSQTIRKLKAQVEEQARQLNSSKGAK